MINIPKLYMLATARIQKLHKHPRPSNKTPRRSTKFKFKESQKQCRTESHVFHPVAAAVAASSHFCRTFSCGAMGHRGRFLFFTAAEYFRKVQTWLQNVQSNLMLCLHGMQEVHSRFDMLAGGSITSADFIKKKMKKGGFSVLMNIVRFCTNRGTSHSTLEHTSCQCIGGRTVNSTPYRTRTCTQQFFSHFGARTPFSVSSPNVASQSSARHVDHGSHTLTTTDTSTTTFASSSHIHLTLHVHKEITVNTTNCTTRSGKTRTAVLSSTPG